MNVLAGILRRGGHASLRDRRGQAMVEFALIAPILLILILGVVEFARAWNAYQVITDAAREGARVAVVNNNEPIADSVRFTVRSAMGRAGLNPNVADIELQNIAGLDCVPGSCRELPATVGVAYPYRIRFVSALLKWSTGDADITLRTTFVMRNE